MPTPSSDTFTTQVQVAAVADADTSDTLRFRAPTLEAAIALAETSLGARVRVVAANRIRRGGIGGFFASDLGVEVTVALDDETVEQALDRIAAGSAVEERVQFESRLAQQLAAFASPAVAPSPTMAPSKPSKPSKPSTPPTSSTPSTPSAPFAPAGAPAEAGLAARWVGRRFDQRDDEPAPTVNPVLSEVLAALMAEAAEQQTFQPEAAQEVLRQVQRQGANGTATDRDERDRQLSEELAAAFAAAARRSDDGPDAQRAPLTPPVMIVGPSTAVDTGRRPVYTAPPTMVRVEQIIEELSAITAEPVFGSGRVGGRVGRPSAMERTTAADADGTDVSGDRDDEGVTAAHASQPRMLPTLPPRASEFARAASAASTVNHTRAFASPSKLATIDRAPATVAADAASAGPVPVPARLATRAVPTLPSIAAIAAAAAAPAAATTATTAAAGATAVIDDEARSEMEVADQAEMVRMAESVRRALGGDHDPGLASTVDRSEVNGSVHAVLEIDADQLEQMTQDREPGRDRRISSTRQGGSSGAPSRRQVELAVAATDQLIESLKRDEGVKRLSVRVVLRTGDQREVEAEAEWESS